LPKRIQVALDGVVAEAALFEDEAPRTVRALWERLPIRDRTIQARWSGDAGLLKMAIAYGPSQWLAPFMVPLPVTSLGRIDTNLDAFVERCQRIIFEGPLKVEISRLGA
jgi:hypothetical protein